MSIADMLIEVFMAESLLLRVEKLRQKGTAALPLDTYDAILQTHFHDAAFRIQHTASNALAALAEGDLLRTFLMGVKRFSKYPARNTVQLRRKVADALIAANAYAF